MAMRGNMIPDDEIDLRSARVINAEKRLLRGVPVQNGGVYDPYSDPTLVAAQKKMGNSGVGLLINGVGMAGNQLLESSGRLSGAMGGNLLRSGVERLVADNQANQAAVATGQNKEMRARLAGQFPDGRVVGQGGFGKTTNMTPEQQAEVLGRANNPDTVVPSDVPQRDGIEMQRLDPATQESFAKAMARLGTIGPAGMGQNRQAGGQQTIVNTQNGNDTRYAIGDNSVTVHGDTKIRNPLNISNGGGNGYTSATGLQVEFPAGTPKEHITAMTRLGSTLDRGLADPDAQSRTKLAHEQFLTRQGFEKVPADEAAFGVDMNKFRPENRAKIKETLINAKNAKDIAEGRNGIERLTAVGTLANAAEHNAITRVGIEGQNKVHAADVEEKKFTLGQQQEIANLQKAYENAPDEKTKKNIEGQLVARGALKQQKPEVFFDPTYDNMGNLTGKKPYILENGVVRSAIPGGEQVQAAPPPKDKLKKDQIIETAKGKFIWTGTGFVPTA